MAMAVQRLVLLGHHRIVLLCREERRKPGPGYLERAFLKELKSHGLATGSYNLPDWEDSPAGFYHCLSSLFRYTPPTTLFISGMELFAATQGFLLEQGIRVPKEVSIICTDTHPTFTWCHRKIAHITYDSSIWVHNIVRWVNKVARGKNDRRQMITNARFIEGGTIGPAPQQ